MNKSSLIAIIVLAIIIIMAIIFGIKTMNNIKEKPTSAQKEMKTIEVDLMEQIEESVASKNSSTTIENNEINKNNENNAETKKEKTDVEKAIDIVKEDWGPDSSVYFAQDGTTKDGRYIICVRDKNSTAALKWYWVNVKNGTFTKE